MLPHTRQASTAYAQASDRTLASRIITDPSRMREARVAIIGCPSDLGVRLNHGRPGAAKGPEAFRLALSRYGTHTPHGFDWPTIVDVGDVIPSEGSDGAALRETHARISAVVSMVIDAGLIPIGIGGGHDHTLALVRPLADRAMKSSGEGLAGLYVDAHLDVRDSDGSGMPFRRLIHDHGVRDVRIVGFNSFVNVREHVAWFTVHGGRITQLPEDGASGISASAGKALIPHSPCFVSIDLDGIDSAYAPGVSAINPCGLHPQQVAAICHAAGASPQVGCFDLMELNPAFDQDHRTARLAVHLFLSFLHGLSERAR